ncbi:MAG: hypothetical protein LBN27_01705 [Prevotellaceae bacterium]|nr:hypothetical protein [Prevotellaceae bacterium]
MDRKIQVEESSGNACRAVWRQKALMNIFVEWAGNPPTAKTAFKRVINKHKGKYGTADND